MVNVRLQEPNHHAECHERWLVQKPWSGCPGARPSWAWLLVWSGSNPILTVDLSLSVQKTRGAFKLIPKGLLTQASYDTLWSNISDVHSFNSSFLDTFRALGVRLKDEVTDIHKPKTGFLWDYQHSPKVGRGSKCDIWSSLLSPGHTES